MSASTVKTVHVSAALCVELERLSSNECGHEACALLFGVQCGASLCLSRCAPVRNARASRDQFAIASKDMRIVLESQAESLGAIYHSHARGTHPSMRDIRCMRRTGVPWLIGMIDRDDAHCGFKINAYLARAGRVYVLPVEKGERK